MTIISQYFCSQEFQNCHYVNLTITALCRFIHTKYLGKQIFRGIVIITLLAVLSLTE